jgi:tripartite-type tricarboxylate transporter receptor subunit TctC
MKKITTTLFLMALCVFNAGVNAQATNYPNQTIKVLVGFAAGGQGLSRLLTAY